MNAEQLEAKVMAQGVVLTALLATLSPYQHKRASEFCSRFYGTLEELTTTGAQVSGARIREEIEILFSKRPK
jgi:hypothetical protein